MTDIALLIAEDFERRMKWLEKGEEQKGFEFSSTMAVASSVLSTIEANIKGLVFLKEKVSKRVTEPKSSLAFDAFSCFFSA
ncbi:hypothetical protein KFK09_022236 [Dendrobium nobile]|uniref:Uncharacterized protein n=1 Tax=Dendrobium nobile TaxID=94219 RepID=A0A8T3AI18_DENNO|nr:hypothetical protein KFK09_022236 [Dendrobium nobile]